MRLVIERKLTEKASHEQLKVLVTTKKTTSFWQSPTTHCHEPPQGRFGPRVGAPKKGRDLRQNLRYTPPSALSCPTAGESTFSTSRVARRAARFKSSYSPAVPIHPQQNNFLTRGQWNAGLEVLESIDQIKGVASWVVSDVQWERCNITVTITHTHDYAAEMPPSSGASTLLQNVFRRIFRVTGIRPTTCNKGTIRFRFTRFTLKCFTGPTRRGILHQQTGQVVVGIPWG